MGLQFRCMPAWRLDMMMSLRRWIILSLGGQGHTFSLSLSLTCSPREKSSLSMQWMHPFFGLDVLFFIKGGKDWEASRELHAVVHMWSTVCGGTNYFGMHAADNRWAEFFPHFFLLRCASPLPAPLSIPKKTFFFVRVWAHYYSAFYSSSSFHMLDAKCVSLTSAAKEEVFQIFGANDSGCSFLTLERSDLKLSGPSYTRLLQCTEFRHGSGHW